MRIKGPCFLLVVEIQKKGQIGSKKNPHTQHFLRETRKQNVKVHDTDKIANMKYHCDHGEKSFSPKLHNARMKAE